MKDHDLILGIENSNPDKDPGGWHGEVALVRGGQLLGRERLRPRSNRDDELLPAIDRLARRVGAVPSEIKRIAVSTGPGGFTGLRIATVTAKCLAEANRGCVIPVPTSDALVRRVDGFGEAGSVVVVALAWKAGSVWRSVYNNSTAPDSGSAGGLVAWRDVLAIDHGGRRLVLVCDEVIEQRAREAGAIGAGVVIQRPRFDAVAVIEASAGRSPADLDSLIPLYPREPEAVTKWRTLHPG